MPSPPGSIAEAASEALFQVKLLSALRNGDPASIHPFLVEIGRSKMDGATDKEGPDLAAMTLHLGIRCASYDTMILLLSHRSISPNAIHPPGSRTSALHLAASLGRVDVVELLLQQDGIDDTVTDVDGRSVLDVATKEAKEAILESRALLMNRYLELLAHYTASPQTDVLPAALLTLLSSPRSRNVDLSALDAATGTTLLHEAARRNDFRLVELAVRAGADVFVRDRRGRAVEEAHGKGGGKPAERIRVFLRQFTNRDTTLMDPSSSEPPALQGYLNKYVNVAKGYGSRWFVLKNGVLSYYHNREDESLACRGSISMKSVKLKTHSADKLRFDIHASTSRNSKLSHHSASATTNTQKWYIRANHPVEFARWTQAIDRNIQWYQSQDKQDNSSIKSAVSTGAESSARVLGTVDSTHVHAPSRPSSARQSTRHLARLSTADTTKSSQSSWRGRDSPTGTGATSTAEESGAELGSLSSRRRVQVGPATTAPLDTDAQSIISYKSTEGLDDVESIPPYQSNFLLQQNSLESQLQLTSQLLSTLALPSSATPRAAEIKTSLTSSLGLLQSMLTDYTKMTTERELWWKKRVRLEKERQRVWETSLAGVVGESEGLEQELRKLRAERRERRRKDRESKMLSSSPVQDITTPRASATEPEQHDFGLGDTTLWPITESETIRSRTLKPNRRLPTPPPVEPLAVEAAAFGAAIGGPSSHIALQHVPTISVPPLESSLVPMPTPPRQPLPPPIDASVPHQLDTLVPGHAQSVVASALASEDSDDDDNDEFFDAVDSGTLSKKLEMPPLIAPLSSVAMPASLDLKQYEAYENLRSRLPIGSDNRPPVSLWAVLKGSIGKDLTKISFPVFFNEPTSMLQRMAEDMEFTECLDAAALQSDSHRRIAYVAAFAMSNYSSTIGRIAKPFNPMLSETFEYCRLDRQYRYVSEQVSHHPPISACWSESPLWSYYGEVDAQNKFMGKSFEIRPTGVAHVDLKLPADFVAEGLKYPLDSGYDGRTGSDKVIEHYSWKKVTTNVSGFILGSPTIDHYGTMKVTNHRTGDTCVLTFKPRGWRGKDFGEISGAVMDKAQRTTWEIAGRWSTQLVARPAGSGNGNLGPDVTLPSGQASSSMSSTLNPEKFLLLWQNTVKPTAPFNLTPFAITLNDCPPMLRRQLPPTDCRLRPDQRTFEMGQYERANELKSLQEEYQRATRKKRETGEMGPHRPRWFTPTVEKDTGERVWAPVRVDDRVKYWLEREKVWKADGLDRWDVEDIFVKVD